MPPQRVTKKKVLSWVKAIIKAASDRLVEHHAPLTRDIQKRDVEAFSVIRDAILALEPDDLTDD